MKRLLVVFALAGAALAGEPARATLQVRKTDRAVAVRAPSATAVLTVVRHGATARLEVTPDEQGYWRLDAVALAGGATLLSGGVALVELLPAGEGAAAEPPALIEAGDAVIEAPAPAEAAADPGACSLTLENEDASIRQDIEGADVFISGENPADCRAVFTAHVAPDQAGPTTATLSAGPFTRSWPARVWSWRWTAERASVARGGTARFRLEVDGLPEGASCDITLQASNGLKLAEAPGTFLPAGENAWTARVTEGTFVFEAPVDGEAAVTADLEPVCESGK